MKSKEKDIAKERIVYLFKQSEIALKKGRKDLSRRYITIARKIGTKFQIPISRELKRKHCKKCNIYWIAGKTLRSRIKKKEKKVVLTCLECGNAQRYPFVKEKKSK